MRVYILELNDRHIDNRLWVFRGLQAAVDRAKQLQVDDYARYTWYDQPIEGWAYHTQTAIGDGPWMRVIGADVEE